MPACAPTRRGTSLPELRGVLITRPEPDASETADLLRDRGWRPVVAPLLTVRPVALRPARSCATVLITSGNALPALGHEWHGVPVLAVGDRTAARARAAGFLDVCSADGDATALLALARARCAPGAALLLPVGAGQGVQLASELRTAGFRVFRRTAYHAGAVRRLPDAARQGLGSGTVDAAMFLSTLTAQVFARLLPRELHVALASVDAVVIGSQVATALAHLPWRRVRVSAKPTLERVLALL